MFLDKALTAPGAEEYRKIREEEKNLFRDGAFSKEDPDKAREEYGKKYGVQPPRGMMASEKAHMILEANYIRSVEGDKPAIDADIAEVLGALDRADLELLSISGRIKANKEAVESAELSYQGLVAQFDELEETLKTTIRFLEEHPPAEDQPEAEKKQYLEDLSSTRETLQGLPESREKAAAQQEEHREKAAAIIAADEDNLTKSGYLLAWRAIELQIAAYIQSKYDCSPLITQTIDRVKELGFTFTLEAEQECKNLSQQWIDRTEALDISEKDFQGPAWETLLSSAKTGKWDLQKFAEPAPAEDPEQQTIPGFFGPDEKRPIYRTRARAGNIAAFPDYGYLVTLAGYTSALAFSRRGNANLEKVDIPLRFDSDTGTLSIEGTTKALSEAKLQNLFTRQKIEEVDTAHLSGFFSLFYTDFLKTGELHPTLKVYIPDLEEAFSGQRRVNKEQRQRLINLITSYHNIVGVMSNKLDGRKKTLPVLLYAGDDEAENTVTILSPYMTNLISEVEQARIKKDKKGADMIKASGEPKKLPAYAKVKPSIYKERATLAVEIVYQLVALIELAGAKGTPRIKADTLLSRTPQFAIRYSASTNKQQFLKRTFSKVWEILRKDTYLEEEYIDIVLPDPSDPKAIPTPKNLATAVFSFPHNGKRADKEGNRSS